MVVVLGTFSGMCLLVVFFSRFLVLSITGYPED